jgi:hypothetical protein
VVWVLRSLTRAVMMEVVGSVVKERISVEKRTGKFEELARLTRMGSRRVWGRSTGAQGLAVV